MREIYKTYEQLKLLEDHALEIAAGTEACPDCLFKHINAISAYSQEVATLNPNDAHFYLTIADQARKWRKNIFEKESGGNPGKRAYEPYGLTAKEAAAKRRVKGRCTPRSQNPYCRLVRCIKKLEPRERAGEIQSAVAVCRATIK